MLARLAFMALGVVDTAMVGSLGERQLAAMAMGHLWSFGFISLGLGLFMGLDPLFAQAHGAGRREEMGRTLGQALVLSMVASAPIVAAHFLAGPGLALLRQPPDVVPLAAEYCRALSWGVPPTMAYLAIQSFLQGQGLMRPGLWVLLPANVLNVVANAALIFGWGPIPAMGAPGSGHATSLVRWTLPVLIWLFAAAALREHRGGMPLRPDLARLRRMVVLGAPIGLQLFVEVAAFNAVGVMMGWLGSAELAGHAVALNIASLSFMVPLGISAAAATRVGNLVGAGQPWSRPAWISIGMGVSFMALSALAFAVFPEAFSRMYTRDEAVVAMAAALLPLAAAFQLFDGVQVVSQGVLRGLGDTRMPPLIAAVAFWGVGVPLAAVLGFPLGLAHRGIWSALVLALGVVATLLLLRVRHLERRGVTAVIDA